VKRGWLLWLVGANVVALVVLAFVAPHLMVAPGPLVPAHAGMATDCFACHAPLRGASPQLCIGCHAVADIGLKTTKGAPIRQKDFKVSFHQSLMEQDCMACHTDHARPRLTRPERMSFSHALLQARIRESCDSCHVSPTDNLHRKVAGNCAACHTQKAWKPATFDHAKSFVLDRDHNVDCITCHQGNDFSRYTCYGCHEHTLSNIRAEHEEEGIRDFRNCVECHRSAQEEPRVRGGKAGASGDRGKKD
jgi:hypothetical protein